MIAAIAVLYTLLAVIVAGFQLMLVLGAPWGHLTMGGQRTGRLPGPFRALAAVQAALILVLAWVVLAHAGVVAASLPGWAIWVATAFSALSALANIATPSKPERRLWAPPAVLMALAALAVALLG